MLSLSCGQASLFAVSGHGRSSKIPSKYPEILVPWANSPSGSFRYGNLSIPRSRFRAKSARTEGESDKIHTFETSDEQKASSHGISSSPSNSFLSLLCPLLKLFGQGDPSQERNTILEVATTSLSSLARFPWGSKSLIRSTYNLDSTSPPNLQLYEFEACPFCRRVREAITELDLSVEVYPCPKGSLRHREIVRKIGGKEQFPFLVDLNTGISIYESGDIVKYLFQKYGRGRTPTFGLLESTLVTGWLPTLLRAGRGMTAWEKAGLEPPPRMLELFSYENNPYARIVREALCELELPYLLLNAGEGSSRTEMLIRASGSNEVPYLIDPNTGAQMGDHRNILTYLFQTYSSL